MKYNTLHHFCQLFSSFLYDLICPCEVHLSYIGHSTHKTLPNMNWVKGYLSQSVPSFKFLPSVPHSLQQCCFFWCFLWLFSGYWSIKLANCRTLPPMVKLQDFLCTLNAILSILLLQVNQYLHFFITFCGAVCLFCFCFFFLQSRLLQEERN